MGSRIEKAKIRLKSIPKDYTYDECRCLLSTLGFEEYNKGKTSGSRVVFIRNEIKISLHKPHPGNIMKQYAVRQIVEQLEELGEL